MSEDFQDLEDAASRYFAARVTRELLNATDAGAWADTLWDETETMGYTRPLPGAAFWQPEADAGAEQALLAASARHCTPLPLAESMLAAGLLEAVGCKPPVGPLGLGFGLEGLRSVAWGRHVRHCVLISGPDLLLLPSTACTLRREANLANEPRDLVEIFNPDRAIFSAALPLSPQQILERAALMRAAQMAAVIERVLNLSIGYANERKQFGRPIAAFQAIQHQLAVLAGQAAAAKMAVLSAYDELARFGGRGGAGLAAAMAKARCGEAAGIACAIAHQVHGAMGFTHEHALQFHTRRLQSWRSEYGSDRYWQEHVGRMLLAQGADALWPALTAA